MLHLSPRFTETFESLPNPLSPLLQGEMSRSDRGGSADNEQIGIPNRGPPSAFGISPARGEKGSFSKVSVKRGL